MAPKTKKAAAGPAELNPFELRTNKRKHDVLGQKRKGEQGHRGQARDAATRLRDRTLFVELKQRGKSNQFVDKRIGEHDASMTPEERMLARFQKDRARTHHKAGLFHLGDDEGEETMLTHMGQVRSWRCFV